VIGLDVILNSALSFDIRLEVTDAKAPRPVTLRVHGTEQTLAELKECFMLFEIE
jgi:hypothetical protein